MATPGALFVVPFLLIGLAALAFWIWMIIDCVTNEPSTGNDKIVWVIIILFAQIVGAVIYYFLRHRPRRMNGVVG
jgi:sterol desaturase/sphingolipid hydroxylase (fatty acid hydroxylase superfamily)